MKFLLPNNFHFLAIVSMQAHRGGFGYGHLGTGLGWHLAWGRMGTCKKIKDTHTHTRSCLLSYFLIYLSFASTHAIPEYMPGQILFNFLANVHRSGLACLPCLLLTQRFVEGASQVVKKKIIPQVLLSIH